MPATRAFTHFVLRTTDAPAARAFYAAVLGHERSAIVPLHEQALARGARPHWLGQIEVDDVDSTARAFLRAGAEALGPKGVFPDGRRFAVFRDPGGAIVGITSPSVPEETHGVIGHQLHSLDPTRTEHAYGDAFGWRVTSRTHDATHGELLGLAGAGADGDIATLVDIRGEAGRHAHWLFHLRVSDLDRAAATVRAEGGLVLGPFLLRTGERLAVCDDPQGAAFALRA